MFISHVPYEVLNARQTKHLFELSSNFTKHPFCGSFQNSQNHVQHRETEAWFHCQLFQEALDENLQSKSPLTEDDTEKWEHFKRAATETLKTILLLFLEGVVVIVRPHEILCKFIMAEQS